MKVSIVNSVLFSIGQRYLDDNICIYDWFAISGLCTNFSTSAATSSEVLRTVSRHSYTS